MISSQFLSLLNECVLQEASDLETLIVYECIANVKSDIYLQRRSFFLSVLMETVPFLCT